jgi:ADP-ribose pyrophosphatase YjhB (NUDIX family)
MQTRDNAKFHIVLVKGWIEKNRKFLLAKRSNAELHKPGVWSLPGGKVENEIEPNILQKTLKKEIKEEVGVEITNDIELVFNNSFERVDGANVVSLTFLCHYKSGEAKPLEDTVEIRWFSIEELKNFTEIEDFLKIEIIELVKYLESSKNKRFIL